nr:Ycf39 [Ochrosphaera neapolitana]
MSLLVIGGTGTLGRQIVKRALDEGYQVKCLVRNLRRSVFLRDWGAELVYGDLALPETIPPALKGVRVVIDAATVRPTDDYNAERIDWKGKIALLEAAKLADVKSFFFFSFIGAEKNLTIPLLNLKVKFAERLKESGINSIIFESAGFFQGLIEQYAIPTLEKQTIWLLKNIPATAYIDTQDAASIVVSSLNEVHDGQIVSPLVGVKAWTPEEIIQLCERLSGQKAKISYLPAFILTTLRSILRSLEFTWNIADRLQFSEILQNPDREMQIVNIKSDSDLLTLERYLQDYFSKILKKLKETNYQQSQQNNDISFL